MQRVNVDAVTGRVSIDTVALPFYVCPDFVTPAFKKALNYWSHYQVYAQRTGVVPFTTEEYLDQLCLALGSAEIRGRDAERWKERVMEHFTQDYMAGFFSQRITVAKNDIFPPPPGARQ